MFNNYLYSYNFVSKEKFEKLKIDSFYEFVLDENNRLVSEKWKMIFACK